MKRTLTAFAVVCTFIAACVPWDALMEECLQSGRCELSPDGAVVEVDAGDDAGAGDNGPDGGVDAGLDAGFDCPEPVDDSPSQGGCRHGGICGAIFINNAVDSIFPVDKTNPCGFAEAPVVSVFADRALIAWTDVDAGPTGSPLRRVRWTELSVDAPAVTETKGVGTGNFPQASPAVAYRGDGGAIAWTAVSDPSRFNDAYVARLSNGAVSTAMDAFETDVNQTELSLAASPDGYLLLFREQKLDAGSSAEGIRGVRLNTSAVPQSGPPGVAVAMLNRFQVAPMATFDGVDYRAVFSDSRNGNNENLYDTYTARIDTATLATTPANGLVLNRSDSVQDRHPSIACASPRLCAVAYMNGNGAVRVQMLIDGGVSGTPTQLSSRGSIPDSSTGIGFTGRDFLVAWAETSQDAGTNIHYRRVSLDGGFAGGELTLLNVSGDQRRPSVSCSLAACAIVWEH